MEAIDDKVSDNIDDDFVVDPSFVTLVAVLIQSYPVSQSGTCSEPTLAYWGEIFGDNIFEILRLLIFILQADKNDQHR